MSEVAEKPEARGQKPETGRSGGLMWWVAGAFALLLTAWSAFFYVASRHRVPEVPLATHGERG